MTQSLALRILVILLAGRGRKIMASGHDDWFLGQRVDHEHFRVDNRVPDLRKKIFTRNFRDPGPKSHFDGLWLHYSVLVSFEMLLAAYHINLKYVFVIFGFRGPEITNNASHVHLFLIRTLSRQRMQTRFAGRKHQK